MLAFTLHRRIVFRVAIWGAFAISGVLVSVFLLQRIAVPFLVHIWPALPQHYDHERFKWGGDVGAGWQVQ